MTREQELWACALAIEQRHGEAAFPHAAFEIDRFDGEGEHEAAGVWREVLKRLESLESNEAARQ